MVGPALPIITMGLFLVIVVGWLFQPFQGNPPSASTAIVTYLPQEEAAIARYQRAVWVTQRVAVLNKKGKIIGHKTERIQTVEGITLPFLQAAMLAASGGNAIQVKTLTVSGQRVTEYGILALPYRAMPRGKSPFDPTYQVSAVVQLLDRAYFSGLRNQWKTLAAIEYALMTHPDAWPNGGNWPSLAQEGITTPGGQAFVHTVVADMGSPVGIGAIPSLPSAGSGQGLAPWISLIEAVSQKTGVPAKWIGGIILHESGGTSTAGSLAHAYGLMQLEPGTLNATDAQRANPQDNVYIGTLYLKSLAQAAGGDYQLAVCAYYVGQGGLEQLLAKKGLTLGSTTFAEAVASGALNVVPGRQCGGAIETNCNTGTVAGYGEQILAYVALAQQVLAGSSANGSQKGA